MNSFNFVARGITREIERQIAVGSRAATSCRRRTTTTPPTTGSTPRRAKEEADDYRYFPEPDPAAGAADRPGSAAAGRAP